uniref:Uncharacterized protein n=1 Tax=Cyanothece sp. (strain PCC 7425 / ATCC 29141) TaxID=395961 RepID=B8HZB3_CYAP4
MGFVYCYHWVTIFKESEDSYLCLVDFPSSSAPIELPETFNSEQAAIDGAKIWISNRLGYCYRGQINRTR